MAIFTDTQLYTALWWKGNILLETDELISWTFMFFFIILKSRLKLDFFPPTSHFPKVRQKAGAIAS